MLSEHVSQFVAAVKRLFRYISSQLTSVQRGMLLNGAHSPFSNCQAAWFDLLVNVYFISYRWHMCFFIGLICFTIGYVVQKCTDQISLQELLTTLYYKYTLSSIYLLLYYNQYSYIFLSCLLQKLSLYVCPQVWIWRKAQYRLYA